ncbi:MAG: NADH:flavin oxidoreductase/NADH oxidase [Bacteroidales bacterium]
MSKLFSPLSIRSITLRNRIVMSPMCQYSSADGFANDWHEVHYGSRAVGGAGLIITEATAVVPEGRITPGDLGIWKDEHVEGLRKITSIIERHGAVAGIQLAHAGRKASCDLPWSGGKQLAVGNGGWITRGPSAIPFNNDDRLPESLDPGEIEVVITAFRDAAARAEKAGFKVVEIHAAHGYLVQEFLSPLSNKRTDEYGGSFDNRTRLLKRVIKAVRSVWSGDKPLLVRISSTDWADGGWSLEDSVRLAGELKQLEVDLVDCSSGGNIPGAMRVLRSRLPSFAAAVRETGIMTGAVGLITSSAQAEEILSNGSADLVFLGRELLRNPYFPLTATREQGEEKPWPLQYLRARPS